MKEIRKSVETDGKKWDVKGDEGSVLVMGKLR
jgi:hypothetical protein